MRHITLLQGKTLLIELPEGATNPIVDDYLLGYNLPPPEWAAGWGDESYDTINLPSGNWRIIGMLGEVREEQAEQIVGFGDADPSGDRFVVGHRLFDKEQEEPFLFWRDVTALESLDSSIFAEGWYFENPYGEEPKPENTPNYAYSVDVRIWESVQSRVLDRSRCLLLGRDDV